MAALESMEADLADADGADEDGVVFGSAEIGPLTTAITVTVEELPGSLDAWIDFNRDGSFGGPGEQIYFSEELVVGDNNLLINVHM